MKKFGIIAILLLAVTLGGVTTAHFVVNGNQQAVTITETIVSGNKTFADGITIKAKFEDGQNTLNWWTSYSTTEGRVVDCQTDMVNEEWEEPSYINLDISSIGRYVNDEKNSEAAATEFEIQTGIPAEDILTKIKEAPAGTQTVYKYHLGDYLSYLPVEFNWSNLADDISLHVPRESTKYDPLDAFMENYSQFRIPVPDGLIGTLAVIKQKDGNLKYWDFSDNHHLFTVESDGVFSSDALYVAVSGIGLVEKSKDSNGEPIEISAHIMDNPYGAHGIHYIPLTANRNTFYPEIEQSRCVYHFQTGEEVLQLEESIAGDQLLLYSKIDGNIYFTVIDKSTMKEVQKMLIMKDTTALYGIIEKENFVFALDTHGNFVLLGKKGEAYKIEFAGLFAKLPYYMNTCDADFDGNRLVLAVGTMYDSTGEEREPHYELSIFDENGLQYEGHYYSSLTNTDRRHSIVLSGLSHPIKVSFDQ